MAHQLLHPAFRPLPLRRVTPEGWLRNQLRIQADGLSGHLDAFWPDVADSGWIGGRAEGWERGPYWLDGAVPLAYLLDDRSLTDRVVRWMDYILTHQHPDGWLGPVKDTSRGDAYRAYDPWPVFVALKALRQYHEASGDPRVPDVVHRFLRRLDTLLDAQPLFAWGRSRWADLVLSIHWLYGRTREDWLWGLAAKVQPQGYDWRGHFEDFRYTEKMRKEDCDQPTHVVNNAMAVKAAGVWYRQSRDPGDRDAVYRTLEALDRYHGQATGLFTGDEHYAGKSPSQGTELCAVVEYMFSLEVLAGILGDVRLADRLERIAFNALPATFSPDMWAHQYDQQANQVVCRVSEERVYTNNGPDANIFGLEPNYGCCTANMHQGWPKFAAHLWMASEDGGLAAVAYAPCCVRTELRGCPVAVRVETDYPFDERLSIRVDPDRPLRFPLYLRIPSWAEGVSVRIGAEPLNHAPPGSFLRLDREWQPGTAVELTLPMAFRADRRFNDSISISRGPLVYALKVASEWRRLRGEAPHADWEVHPASLWSYALELDPQNPEADLRLTRRPIGPCPFSPDGAPHMVSARGRRVPGWGLHRNAAAPPPQSPVATAEPLEDLTLIPYGCTDLRVTELPLAVPAEDLQDLTLDVKRNPS